MSKDIAPRQTCTTQKFRQDLSELCEDCPLRVSIPKWINETVIAPALKEKNALTTELFKSFIQEQISKHRKEKDLMFIYEQQRKAGVNTKNISVWNLSTLTSDYILNYEAIKALNNLYSGNVEVFINESKKEEFLNFLKSKDIIQDEVVTAKVNKLLLAGIIYRFQRTDTYFKDDLTWDTLTRSIFVLIGVPDPEKRVNKRDGNSLYDSGYAIVSSYLKSLESKP